MELTTETNKIYDRDRFRLYWIVNNNYLKTNNLSLTDVMMNNGYHPAGYGGPSDIKEKKDYTFFTCNSSCD